MLDEESKSDDKESHYDSGNGSSRSLDSTCKVQVCNWAGLQLAQAFHSTLIAGVEQVENFLEPCTIGHDFLDVWTHYAKHNWSTGVCWTRNKRPRQKCHLELPEGIFSHNDSNCECAPQCKQVTCCGDEPLTTVVNLGRGVRQCRIRSCPAPTQFPSKSAINSRRINQCLPRRRAICRKRVKEPQVERGDNFRSVPTVSSYHQDDNEDSEKSQCWMRSPKVRTRSPTMTVEIDQADYWAVLARCKSAIRQDFSWPKLFTLLWLQEWNRWRIFGAVHHQSWFPWCLNSLCQAQLVHRSVLDEEQETKTKMSFGMTRRLF